MGILDTYNNTQFSSVSRPTGRGRFSKYDYTATFSDKQWSVSLNGSIVASDVNSNTSSVNEQLARDWIENDWKRRKAISKGPDVINVAALMTDHCIPESVTAKIESPTVNGRVSTEFVTTSGQIKLFQ